MAQALDGVQKYLDNLVTERQRAWNEANEIVERCVGDNNRAMTVDERTKYDTIAGPDGALDTLKRQIDDFVDRLKTEREHDQLREEWAPVVRPSTEDASARDEFDGFEMWVRSGLDATGNVVRDPKTGKIGWEFDMGPVTRERRALRAGLSGAEFRAITRGSMGGYELRTNLNVGTTTAGKNLVPTDFLRRLYDYLEASSGMRKTNATILTTTGGEPMQMPTVTSHGTAAIVGEGTALAAADAAFGQVTLGAYKYGQLAQITNELLSDSGVDVLGFLARDLGRALGRVTGTAYVKGTGTNSPHGLGPRAGTAVTIQTGSTGVPSYANLVDIVYSVIEEYRDNGALWMMKDSFEGTIRKLTDTQGRPLWQPVVMAGEPDLLMGYPIIDDRNMDAAGTAAGTPMFFGSFEPFYIRDSGKVRIERSDDFAFSSDVVTYRAILRTDSDLIDLTTPDGPVKKVLAPTT
jgi:HK97 family phage major capsid protein